MRISDWSSDVCSSDLNSSPRNSAPASARPIKRMTPIMPRRTLDIYTPGYALRILNHRIGNVIIFPAQSRHIALYPELSYRPSQVCVKTLLGRIRTTAKKAILVETRNHPNADQKRHVVGRIV